ncbi:hypothetical protein H7H48_15810 [Nitratireductor sp. B36]|uniref:hypothetical protein n=1 Tax=Nitratireductor sp. B36 TaxID=2762059 RepID=UPI001E62B922|nr:hypothetical protein [Nitratireductor sp. B36]MCC5780527.1 hypothetical protein [Nitratireductor sp. B36]
MTNGNEQLLRELHAGLAVVKSQQTEINRRLGKIEESLEKADEEAEEKRDDWWAWVLQTIGQVILVTVLVTLGKAFGLELSW